VSEGSRWFVERGFAWLNAYRRLKVGWKWSYVRWASKKSGAIHPTVNLFCAHDALRALFAVLLRRIKLKPAAAIQTAAIH